MISAVDPHLHAMMNVVVVVILLVVAVMMNMIAGTLRVTMTVMAVVAIATIVRVSPVMIILPRVVLIVTRPVVVVVAVVVMTATLVRTAVLLGKLDTPAMLNANLAIHALLLPLNLLSHLLAVKAVVEDTVAGIAMTLAMTAATGDKKNLRYVINGMCE